MIPASGCGDGMMPAHRPEHVLSKSTLANGAESRAVSGDGHTSTLADQNSIIRLGAFGVCDAGHSGFVMKKGRWQMAEVGAPAAPHVRGPALRFAIGRATHYKRAPLSSKLRLL